MAGKQESEEPADGGHTLSSAVWRTGGQVFCLAALGMVGPAVLGLPWAPLALLGTTVSAAVCLITSAAVRSVSRWKQQAADGQAPQSIGIVSLAIAMAAGVEQEAILVAEQEHDYVARLVRDRDSRASGSTQKRVARSAEAWPNRRL
jgi:hypothetical protein